MNENLVINTIKAPNDKKNKNKNKKQKIQVRRSTTESRDQVTPYFYL